MSGSPPLSNRASRRPLAPANVLAAPPANGSAVFKPNTTSTPRPAPTPMPMSKASMPAAKPNGSSPRSFLPKPTSLPKRPLANSGTTPPAKTVLANLKVQPIGSPARPPKYACFTPSLWSLFFPNRRVTICQGGLGKIKSAALQRAKNLFSSSD